MKLFALVVSKRKMALQFHSIVQDTSDFDRSPALPDTQEVPSAPVMSEQRGGYGGLGCSLVPGFGPGNVGTFGKLADREAACPDKVETGARRNSQPSI